MRNWPSLVRGPASFFRAKWIQLFADWLRERFQPRERFILILLVVAFLTGVVAIALDHYRKQTVVVPAFGGHYVEGIVGNRSQLDEIIARVTSVGLVSLSANREVLPVLTKEWSISPDGKTYTFHLLNGLHSRELAESVREEDLFKTVEIQTPDDLTLIFRLKQPFGPFLSLLALPLFPFGPYTLETESAEEVSFIPNEQFAQGRPFLNRITIKIYASEESLRNAVSGRDLDGAVTAQTVRGWRVYETTLPRNITVFLNTEKPHLADVGERRRLLQGDSLLEKITLTVVTSPQLKSYADELVSSWNGQNVETSLRLVEDAALRGEVIPQRDYDVLVYGIDAGIEPDPFRFWHSSQVTQSGLNLAQLKERGLDVLLEEARKIVNDAERFKQYEVIEQKIDELAVRTVLQQLTITYQVSGAIKGVTEPLMVTPGSRYNLVWKWYTKEKRVAKTSD